MHLCHRIYNGYMDVYSTLDGQGFVWDSEKAVANASRHGVRFEQAREVFLDQFACYEDASPHRRGATGMYRLHHGLQAFVCSPRHSRRRCAPTDLCAYGGGGGKETL